MVVDCDDDEVASAEVEVPFLLVVEPRVVV